MSYPRERRFQRNERQTWKGTLFKERPKMAWEPDMLPSILAMGVNPRSSIESVLYSANTLSRCIETASDKMKIGDNAWMKVILARNDIVPTLHYWLRSRTDPGTAGIRLIHHVLHTLTNLLGWDAQTDELIIYDPYFLEILTNYLQYENRSVVAGVARLVHRMSEVDLIAPFLALTDEVLDGILEALREHNDDQFICPELMLTLVGVSGNRKAHFLLARHTPFLQLMIDFLLAAVEGATYLSGLHAAQVIENLVHYPDNVSPLRDSIPLRNAISSCTTIDEAELRAAPLAVDLTEVAAIVNDILSADP